MGIRLDDSWSVTKIYEPKTWSMVSAPAKVDFGGHVLDECWDCEKDRNGRDDEALVVVAALGGLVGG